MMPVVYDAGPLIAADRNDRDFWADHKERLEAEMVPVVPAVVVAQVSRSPRQARLRQILRGCAVASFAVKDAHEVGALLARSGTSDVADAAVVVLAAALGADIVTSDRADIERLAGFARARVRVRVVDT